jgi:hypothetical protein
VGERRSLFDETVEVRCADLRVAKAVDRFDVEIVSQQEQDVGRRFRFGQAEGRQG